MVSSEPPFEISNQKKGTRHVAIAGVVISILAVMTATFAVISLTTTKVEASKPGIPLSTPSQLAAALSASTNLTKLPLRSLSRFPE